MPGPQGPAGPQGIQGVQGQQGIQGETGPAGDVSAAWPIGSVFISVVATNPSVLLGFGTWAALAAGRVLVSQDAGQTEFDTLRETGGAKTHTLTEQEIPSHTHTQNAHTHTQNAHTHVLATGSGASGNFAQVIGTVDTTSGGTGGTPTQTALGTISGSTTAVNQNATAVNQNTGGGQAHQNMPPYFVVRMWERTA